VPRGIVDPYRMIRSNHVNRAVLTGTGLWTPRDGITNAELVDSLAQAVEAWNAENADAIARGELEERDAPNERFIT